MGYCSFLSLVRDPPDVALPKNIVPRDRSRGGRKSDLNLLSLNLVAYIDTLAKSTGSDLWLCVDTQKHQFIHLHRELPGPNNTVRFDRSNFHLLHFILTNKY